MHMQLEQQTSNLHTYNNKDTVLGIYSSKPTIQINPIGWDGLRYTINPIHPYSDHSMIDCYQECGVSDAHAHSTPDYILWVRHKHTCIIVV